MNIIVRPRRYSILALLLLIGFLTLTMLAPAMAVTPEQQAEWIKKLQQKSISCGSDAACMESLVRDIQQIQNDLPQPSPAPVPKGAGPCAECRAHVAWMVANGSAADYECRPLAFDLVWDFTKKEIRTPANRIGPSTSVEMTIKENYPGCAMLTRQQGSKNHLSSVEITAPATKDKAAAEITYVNAHYGLARPHSDLWRLGDEFNTVSSRNTEHYTLDLNKRQFGFEYSCHHAPIVSADPNQGAGSVFMPFVSSREKLIVPSGNWSLIMPYISESEGIELGNYLSCGKIEEAFNAKSTVEHRFPFKDSQHSSTPFGGGLTSKTSESIDGAVTIRIGFDKALEKQKKQCTFATAGGHPVLPYRRLAKIGGKGGANSANICDAVAQRIVDEQIFMDIFNNAKLRNYFKKTCPKDISFSHIVQNIYNKVNSQFDINLTEPITGNINMTQYLNGLDDAGLFDLVYGKTPEAKGALTAHVAMETDLNDCRVSANITDANGHQVKVPVSSNPRVRYSSIDEARKAAAQIKKNKTAVLDYYKKEEGEVLGKIHFEADLAHEMEHVSQCIKGDPMATLDDIKKAEVEAYNKSRDSLKKWHKANCP